MAEFEQRDALARRFHETYERLAPDFGYKTREASAVPWEDVPQANKELMRAVAGEIIDHAVSFTQGYISINLETGQWAPGSPTITGEQGAVVAAAVLPGVTAEEVARWYVEQMTEDGEALTFEQYIEGKQ